MHKIARIPGVAGIKNSGSYTRKYVDAFLTCREREAFRVYEGSEATWLKETFEITDGVVSGSSNVIPIQFKGACKEDHGSIEAILFLRRNNPGDDYFGKSASVFEMCLRELGLCESVLRDSPDLTRSEEERYRRKLETLRREGYLDF